MAIAKRIPTSVPPVELNTPDIETNTYLGIVADNASEPISEMVAYISGMPWTVTYYSQLVGKHNDVRELDVGENGAYQQYQKINQVQIKVKSDLNASYNSEEDITSVTGNATVVGLVPNVHDYFVASAGTRNTGIFRVTDRRRNTFNRGSIYEIDYVLVGYIETDQKPLYANLESKVVRQYFFSIERLSEGLAPVLKREEYQTSKDLAALQVKMIHFYFQRFFNRSCNTLIVPGQDFRVYDVRLMNFILSILNREDASELKEMSIASLDHDRYLKEPTLLTALLERDEEVIHRSQQRQGLVTTRCFNLSSFLKGVAYWNLQFVVYPKEIHLTQQRVFSDPIPPTLSDHELSSECLMESDVWMERNAYTKGEETFPLIKSVLIDDYYILSQAFYESGTELSALEILVRDYLRNHTLDIPMLMAVLKHYFDWPVLEQFYYGPILLVLIKNLIRGFYR